MQLYGLYEKTLKKDILTGKTYFTILIHGHRELLSQYGNILCYGVIPDYMENTPIRITGRMDAGKNGRSVFLVDTIELSAAKNDDAVLFLSGKRFSGVGPKTAEQIIGIWGNDIFLAAARPDAEDVLKKNGVEEKIAATVVKTVRRLSGFHELFAFFTRHGGTYIDALEVHRHYGERAVEVMKKDPYAAVKLGVSFAVCESVGKEYGVHTYDERRVRALVHECLTVAAASGSTALSLSELQKTASFIERRINLGRNTPMFFIGAAVLADNECVTFKDEDEWYVAKASVYMKEKTIIATMKWLTDRSAHSLTDKQELERIEAETGIRYSPEQKEAFDLLSYPGVKILTGGPGTGKTTVLNGLLAYYERKNPDKAIRLCAPTANAARRMKEVTGRASYTVHKLLDIRARDGFTAVSSRRESLPTGLVIVDEASMLDTELFSVLLSKVSSRTILLLVGDEDQLESVGPGDILYDLIRYADVKKCRLKKVYRQKEGSSIHANCIKILNSDTGLTFDADTRIFRTNDAGALCKAAKKAMSACYEPKNPRRVLLLTPVRSEKYDYGTGKLNADLQKMFNGNREQSLIYGGTEYRVGDPVQFTRNNYKTGYINGDYGIVTGIIKDSRGYGLTVRLDDQELTVFGTDLNDTDLAYAGTVHKAQGGECDICIVIVPKRPQRMLNRKMIYVAASRAKKRVCFIVEGDALESAILNESYHARTTGLGILLRNDGG